jgi:hypothetical protein
VKARRRSVGSTIRTEGGLLPVDLLARVAAVDAALPGMDATSYHLAEGIRLSEAITKSWNLLQNAWVGFSGSVVDIPGPDPATSLTREKWLLPLFGEIGYGRLPIARSRDIEGRDYPVSHAWGDVPVHLVGWNVPLDRRTSRVAGAASQSPHGMVQDLLNRSAMLTWGFVSNGRVLRLLRDNVTLTRQAFLEFDLQRMFGDEEYADFALLWLICHQSRLETSGDRPSHLDQWRDLAGDTGARALASLRDGVTRALEALGRGFLSHRANEGLRQALRSGDLRTDQYYRELLRLVYRLIFVFASEDRGVLLSPGATAEAKSRFEYYSTSRLRRLAERRRGLQHTDAWAQFTIVSRCLAAETGEPALGLPALGGLLFAADSTPTIDACELSNRDFLTAIRELATIVDGDALRSVDYRNLGAEELGGIYESLLELHPTVDLSAGAFDLGSASGSERKTSGSYYTPSSLISSLLDSALDPVIERARRTARPAEAILELRVLDPAAGSGHFLVAAAHRLAKALASVKTGESEPSPDELRRALRDVISNCVYGVDLNELAVELCKVSLWLEALEPGRPLSFLDAHIRRGNSLVGATPALIAMGIPDAAFDPVAGDDKQISLKLRQRNAYERGGQTLLAEKQREDLWRVLTDSTKALSRIDDSHIRGVNERATQYAHLRSSNEYALARIEADVWCAAFFTKRDARSSAPITNASIRAALNGQADPALLVAVDRLRQDMGFFHWYLEFPEVYSPNVQEQKAGAGFDVVLGNPPWDKVEFDEREFFAVRNAPIADAPNAAKRRAFISGLKGSDIVLWNSYEFAMQTTARLSRFLRSSGRYPLTGRGRINTFAVFAELMRSLVAPHGRVGVVVPTAAATDDSTKDFFGDVVKTGTLVSLYDFENRLFPDVDRRYKFCLLTLGGTAATRRDADFVFFARTVADLARDEKRFSLSAADLALLNPNTLTAPIFATRRDAELTIAIYRRVPILVREDSVDSGNPWRLTFRQGLFNMATDSGLFSSRRELETDNWVLEGNYFRREDSIQMPLYEAKMVHQFNHRFGDYAMQPVGSQSTQLPTVPGEMYARADWEPLSRYWVDSHAVREQLQNWEQDWLLGWRRIARSTDERTLIVSLIPVTAVGDSLFLATPRNTRSVVCLLANWNSFVTDYLVRQKIGGINLNFFTMRQIPSLPPAEYDAVPPWLGASLRDWISVRVLELTYTSWAMQPVASDLGYAGAPFIWNAERRFLIRCELDAVFFHLYGVQRDDVQFMLTTFPIIEQHDLRTYGAYRTRDKILEIYDAIAAAMAARTVYRTVIDPPPADPQVAHRDVVKGVVVPFPRMRVPQLERYEPAQLTLGRVAEEGVDYRAEVPRRRRRKRDPE